MIIFSTVFINIFNTANADEVKKITLLGDSITKGYGLSDEELNYGDYLGKFFNSDVDNYAVNGLTTEGLLEKLDESEIENSINEADIICLSIGGNDLLNIIEEAFKNFNSNGNLSSENSGNFNISAEFVESFIIDYSTAFGDASVKAGTNIEKIKNKIYEINPDAELVMQTIYVPFESSNENMNKILSPLKTFSSIFISTINNAVKEVSPKTADINLKFSEKPYIYTNIDNFDIHPNYLGHMLIAEEIIQTLALSGDYSVFKDEIDKIPYGIFSQFPDYTANELDEFSNGQMRNCSLEEAIENSDKTAAAITENTEETEVSDQTEAGEQTEQSRKQENEKKISGAKPILSRIFLIAGIAIILFITAFNFIKKRRNR